MDKDDKRRCEILGLEYPPQYSGGIVQFRGATYSQLLTLRDSNTNDSPEYSVLLAFLGNHPLFTAHGYLVSPKRHDYGLVIEGIEGPAEMSKETLEDFIMLCRLADEFSLNPPYAWWD